MKTIKLFALAGIFLAFLRPLPAQASHVEQLSVDGYNYVVIGAFKFHRNATRFAQRASKQLHLNAKFEMNQNRNLYYVYVLSTPSREKAIAEALRLREESELKDTWVYNGSLTRQNSQAHAGMDINPVSGNAIEQVQVDSPPVEEDPASQNPVAPETATNNTGVVTNESKVSEVSLDADATGKEFVFRISKATDNTPIEGEVDVVDTDKMKKMGTFKGNMPVRISSPDGSSGNVTLTCDVFGYRQAQRIINYNNPQAEDIEVLENGNVEVPFNLNRLQKGDIAVMYNVYFYKDAGVMRPESRFEVTSLLEMLKENPKYKIKIHGHTNGNASGKIISLKENNSNFFSLTDTREGFGTAKKLSEERAEVIKNFLVQNGIEESRMQIKAWGGKRPIFDKHHTRAQENVRVEIEILEDK
ncbi:MAG TPA: OmpA family protein [Ohtaekwangia sp.]|nr:OmpA family protein [Ohtaekwangia sp.]